MPGPESELVIRGGTVVTAGNRGREREADRDGPETGR
jgi:hypothetical protein